MGGVKKKWYPTKPLQKTQQGRCRLYHLFEGILHGHTILDHPDIQPLKGFDI